MSNYMPPFHSPLREKPNGVNGISSSERGHVAREERESLFASISNTSHPFPPNQQALTHDIAASSSTSNAHHHHPATANPPLPLPLPPPPPPPPSLPHAAVGGGLPVRRISNPTSPVITRPASPYTLNPPIDYDGLSWPSIGTRARLEATPEEEAARLEKLAGAVRTVLECIGEDPEREGLQGTPERYAKAMLYFTKGYEQNVRDIVGGAVFQEDHDEMVIVRDIEIFSLCEHHLVPFTGKMHIGYIPNGRVLGLSKLARIAEMFSRRLQVQERLTKQIALAISEILRPQGVAVVVESSHLCMVMRGVEKTSAITTTSCMLGRFRQSAKTREEFMNLILARRR